MSKVDESTGLNNIQVWLYFGGYKLGIINVC